MEIKLVLDLTPEAKAVFLTLAEVYSKIGLPATPKLPRTVRPTVVTPEPEETVEALVDALVEAPVEEKIKEKAEAPVEEKVEPAEEKITLDTIRQAFAAKNTPENRPKLKEILTDLGATSISNLQQENYAEALSRVKEL